jgi:acyl-CoA synthetase (AMP-forming)/AMP-acid ligase II
VAERGATTNFRDGWFYPGDLVSQRSGEPLVFRGRSDDVMILNGINVFPWPSRIRWKVMRTPKRRSPIRSNRAFTARFPSRRWCFIRRRGRAMRISCWNFVGSRSAFAGPRQIVVVDRIPRNAAGKPLRRELGRT